MNTFSSKRLLSISALCVLCFSVLCFISYLFTGRSYKTIESYIFYNSGGAEQFEVKDPSRIFRCYVSQKLDQNAWSYVTVTIADPDSNELLIVGDEFWDEVGMDDGVVWHENKLNFATNLKFQKAGKHTIIVEAENQDRKNNGNIRVAFDSVNSSDVPFKIAFIIGLVVAFILDSCGQQFVIRMF